MDAHTHTHIYLKVSSLIPDFKFLLQEGQIDMLSSDHSPTEPELKLLNDGNFLRAWGGISSLQVGFLLQGIKSYELLL